MRHIAIPQSSNKPVRLMSDGLFQPCSEANFNGSFVVTNWKELIENVYI
jgi:hypothetical protein